MNKAKANNGAEGQTRTVDTGIFSAVLYHLSYLGSSVYYQIYARPLSRSQRDQSHFLNNPSLEILNQTVRP